MADPAGQPIRGLDFGGKWLEFISWSQITGDYSFSQLIEFLEHFELVTKRFSVKNKNAYLVKI